MIKKEESSALGSLGLKPKPALKFLMRKYYTRPCNFYYGNYARRLIKKKKGFL